MINQHPDQGAPVPPDFRALCAELAKLDGHCVVDCTEEWAEAMCRLRAVLAQPVPPMPTDEELLSLAAASISPYETCGIEPGQYEAETECAVEVYGSELVTFARAVLARWGNTTPQPPDWEASPLRDAAWERMAKQMAAATLNAASDDELEQA